MKKLQKALLTSKLTVACAESCTGGLVARLQPCLQGRAGHLLRRDERSSFGGKGRNPAGIPRRLPPNGRGNGGGRVGKNGGRPCRLHHRGGRPRRRRFRQARGHGLYRAGGAHRGRDPGLRRGISLFRLPRCRSQKSCKRSPAPFGGKILAVGIKNANFSVLFCKKGLTIEKLRDTITLAVGNTRR